jgi:hypothetical protein
MFLKFEHYDLAISEVSHYGILELKIQLCSWPIKFQIPNITNLGEPGKKKFQRYEAPAFLKSITVCYEAKKPPKNKF